VPVSSIDGPGFFSFPFKPSMLEFASFTELNLGYGEWR